MKEFVFTMLAVFVVLSGGVWAQASELAQIVFHSNRDLHNNIYVMNAHGKNLRNLTNSRASDGEPAWFDPRFTSTVGPAGKLRSTWGRIKTRSYTLSR